MTLRQFIGLERLVWWNNTLGVLWAALAFEWFRLDNIPHLVFCAACSAFNFGRAFDSHTPDGAPSRAEDATP